MKHKYHAGHGGHAPGHLREAFATFVEYVNRPELGSWYGWFDNQPRGGYWLLGQLWNCTDIMPSLLCHECCMQPGSTYAQGARDFRKLVFG